MTAIASMAASEKAAAAAKRLANLRPFKPGQSGNPGGRLSNGKRYQELFAAIAGEFGGESELTAMEREFVSRAAEQLRRAERAKSNNELVRLTRCAAQLIDRVRDNHRRQVPSGPSLAEHLATRYGAEERPEDASAEPTP
jgi:hypothetical protein